MTRSKLIRRGRVAGIVNQGFPGVKSFTKAKIAKEEGLFKKLGLRKI